MTPFLKMHGLGNDFVVFDARNKPVSLGREQARAIADRRLGIGCDQVIVIDKATNGADAVMRIFNADGGEVESCGNAARCVARLLMDETGRREVRIETEGGPLVCADAAGLVTVDMGTPRFDWRQIPLADKVETTEFRLEVDGHAFDAAVVNVGNPHCVLFVRESPDDLVRSAGPRIEHDPMFPERTNVEFVQISGNDQLRLRVWERGTGVTLACGTGACAAMAAAHRRGLCGTRAEIVLDGGPLTMEWQGGDTHIFMTGPTALVYRGEIDLAGLA
ncbi:MAG TPA: diaminopimelate epimerase [Rhizomicrobium sp.]|jgi:diaminopimelate epimerase|nr:diaminopimelate epimerase [Rhizomicrobium sp.]